MSDDKSHAHGSDESACDAHECDVAEDDIPRRTDGGVESVSPETVQFVDGIGSDLEHGELPLRVYNDPEIFQLELDRIFGNNWVFVGHETEIPEEGDYVKRYIGQDPFIFTRDEDGEIHVLFDSCRHRGSKVCRAEKGNTSHFRCPYHGWTYKNNGDLAAVPQKENAYEGMDLSEWGLLEAPRVTNYKGLVFASINEDVPEFEEYIGDFQWYLDIHLSLTDGGIEVIGDPFRYRINSNWKVGAENFAGDGYHTHTTHRSAIDTFVEREWSWEGERDYEFISDIEGYYNGTTLMGLFQDDDIDAFWGYPDEVKEQFNPDNLSEDQWDIARRSAIHVGTVFPNLSIHHQNVTPPGERPIPFFSLRKWMPRSPDEMEVLNLILAPKETPAEWKEKIHQAAVYSFGPSGNFDQDDAAVWSGITDSAGGTFAKKHDVKLNYKMGMDDIGKAERDEDWNGPGYASDVIHEGYSRTYHSNWVKAMQKPPGSDHHDDTLSGIDATENAEADD
jgi:phenylpropionate dioxygenase-like ring-hydroxylating dioxygenase large terminal subunit